MSEISERIEVMAVFSSRIVDGFRIYQIDYFGQTGVLIEG
jgi:hypothetical protein